MSYYGEEQPDELAGQRSYDPYVMTPRGPMRKIGSKAKYGLNANTGDQVQSSQRQKTSTRLGSSPSRLGTAFSQTESRFATSQREADEQTRANKAYEGRFDRRAAEIAADKQKGLVASLGEARATARNNGKQKALAGMSVAAKTSAGGKMTARNSAQDVMQ